MQGVAISTKAFLAWSSNAFAELPKVNHLLGTKSKYTWQPALW